MWNTQKRKKEALHLSSCCKMMVNYDRVIRSQCYRRKIYYESLDLVKAPFLVNFIFHYFCLILPCQCAVLVIHSLARLDLVLRRMADTAEKRWCHPSAKLHYYSSTACTLIHLSLLTLLHRKVFQGRCALPWQQKWWRMHIHFKVPRGKI